MKRIVSILTLSLMLVLAPFPAYGLRSSSYQDYPEIIQVLEQYYYKPVDTTTLIENSYRGVFSSLDPYSYYLSASELEDFIEEMKGNYTGIGIRPVPTSEGIEILEVFPDSPAGKAGLLPEDLITTVNGTRLNTLSPYAMADPLLGEAGTAVSITYVRNGVTKTTSLQRAEISVESIESKMLRNGVGYIRIVEFQDQTSVDYANAFSALQAQGMTSLILDLRDNPGGYMGEALTIAEGFCPSGSAMLYEKTRAGEEVYRNEGAPHGLRTAVLVNENSASASEVLCGIIKANRTGTLIGTKTFGKGIVQDIYPLDEGNRGAIKFTIAEYFVTNHTAVHGIGVQPDVFVEDSPLFPKTELLKLVPITAGDAPLNASNLNVYAVEQRLAYLGNDLTADGVLDQKTWNLLQGKGWLTNGVLTAANAKSVDQYIQQFTVTRRPDPQLDKALELMGAK